VRRFTGGSSVEYPIMVVYVIVAAIMMNAALVIYQNHVVKTTKSLAIEADRAHYSGDIGIHIGVLIAVGADYFYGIKWVDPLVAVFISLWLARLAFIIGCKAIDMLMDKELPECERVEIRQIIKRTRGVVDFHDLRTNRSGMVVMMSFDIEVEESLSFLDAHNIARRVEDRLHKLYPRSEIMIHVDPCGDITDSRHRQIKGHHVR